MANEVEPIVITGLGVLACNGMGREAFWDSLEHGRTGIRTITRFDPDQYPTKIAGQLWDFDPNDFVKRADIKRWHRVVHQALAATQMAMEESELGRAGYDPERLAVGIGTSVGSLDETYHDHMLAFKEHGWEGVDRLASSTVSSHASTANVSAKFGLRGPAITIGSGCSSGIDVLTWGKHQIRSGLADAAVVGATESPLYPLPFAATCRLGIMSTCNDAPDKAVKPFAADSDGLVLSEAAVMVIMERAGAARARGARILGELAGTGSAAEGQNPLVLQREGDTVARSITNALGDAGMLPHEIECAHCHGVAIQSYDRSETNGYKLALGEHAFRIPLTATKCMVGQSYSAGGLISVAAALMTLNRGVLPATLNLEQPDPQCDLDYVPLQPRMNDLDSALVTALSYGGTHTAAVLRQFR